MPSCERGWLRSARHTKAAAACLLALQDSTSNKPGTAVPVWDHPAEFLKEHRKMQEQDARLTKQEALIAQQQKQIEVLTAGLQKVTAQLELSRAVPRAVSE